MPTDSTDPTFARFAATRFRAGEAYELVVFDRLSDDEQAMFGELAADPDFYGVLRPRASGLTYRAADRDTALLLLTLAQPGPLPFFARDPEVAEGLAALVLDGVLEIEHGGGFVGGAPAAELVASKTVDRRAQDHRLGRLAREALRLAAALESDDPSRLAAFLYDFNRLPVAPETSRRLDGREAVLVILGVGRGTRRRRELEAAWEIPAETDGAWIFFRSRQGREGIGGTAYKLYVSPRPEALPRAFEVLVEVLGRRQGAFKVGASAAGLFRADKMVAYFDDLESLLAVARELEEKLADLPAQGVPFTAPIDPGGLLSWGVDPPASERPLSWQGPESWRTWLAGRLAAALARGVRDGSEPAESCRFALTRLAHDGVDVERWIPAAGRFRAV